MTTETDKLFDILRGNTFRGDPNQIPQESIPVGGGNAQPAEWYAGHAYSSAISQSNLLADPSLDSLATQAFGVTEVQASVELFVIRTKASGTDPTTNTVTQVTRADVAVNSFGSSMAVFALTGAASACDLTDKVYSKAALTIGANRVALSYLVGAVRVFRHASPWNITAVSALTVTLELVKNIAGTAVVINSDSVDMLTMASAGIRQLVVAAVSPFTNGDTYDLRVLVRFVTTGSGTTNLKLGIVEPQLSFAYTRDVLPYVPERSVGFTFGGDGSDGEVVVNSSTFSAGPITSNALTGDAYFTNLIVEAGFVLDTKGFRVFCTDIALINGTLRCNGGAGGAGQNGISNNPATGGTAGAAATATNAPMPSVSGINGLSTTSTSSYTAGIDAVSNSPSIGSLAKGGGGGGSPLTGPPQANGADTSTPSTPTGARQLVTLINWATIFSAAWTLLNGSHKAGGGGGGGAYLSVSGGAGGGSGAAGGNLVLVARVIGGSGAIEAKGGNGGNGGDGQGGSGGGGGGAGGSGGVLVLVYSALLFSGALTKTGGTSGAAGIGGGDGGIGPSGPAGPTERRFKALARR